MQNRHTKVDLLLKTLRARDRPGRARTVAWGVGLDHALEGELGLLRHALPAQVLSLARARLPPNLY